MVIDPHALREMLLTFRQALLLMVDGIERFLEINPRTSELRKEAKDGN